MPGIAGSNCGVAIGTAAVVTAGTGAATGASACASAGIGARPIRIGQYQALDLAHHGPMAKRRGLSPGKR